MSRQLKLTYGREHMRPFGQPKEGFEAARSATRMKLDTAAPLPFDSPVEPEPTPLRAHRCTNVKKNGDPCNGKRLPGLDTCVIHRPGGIRGNADGDDTSADQGLRT